MTWKVKLNRPYPLQSGLLAVSLKWRTSHNKLIRYNTERPVVHLLVMLLPQNHFRG